MRMGLGGRVVVITGASRGIGSTLAERFAEQGATLGLLARSEPELKELASRLPTEAIPVACDVTDPDSVDSAFHQIAARWGRVDSVVANAGISLGTRRVHNLPVQAWQDTVSVNLTGAFLTARAAYRHLCRSPGGRLVLISSVMARAPRHGVSAYAATKAGLEGLARAAAADWATDGICVNAVAPGFINSGMGTTLPDNDRILREILARTPLRRLGTATDLVALILFLAGDASGFITGQVLTVDGGYGLD